MREYRSKFEGLISELKNNSKINLLEGFVGEKRSVQAIREEQERLNLPILPPSYLEFYAAVGSGIKISWECNLLKNNIARFECDQRNAISGVIDILPFPNLGISHPKVNSKCYYRHFEAEELEDIPFFRLIETWNNVVNIGWLIDREKNEIEDELYYLANNSDGFGFPSLSLNHYLDTLLKYRGFSNWQYPFLMKNTEKIEHYIKQIF
ncbi:hypothetical protein [Aureispira anguillae]|uniref:Uncharacterized protein n=1 Tax=Aureispira anguillae TaxID=2864201 RepID=A0A916DVZ1_9BACT|nr:hypothetical protein [Aureispira anguillae]BDS14232.1 hypothetical protein AsAng_0050110 [Aureispira anguillae]